MFGGGDDARTRYLAHICCFLTVVACVLKLRATSLRFSDCEVMRSRSVVWSWRKVWHKMESHVTARAAGPFDVRYSDVFVAIQSIVQPIALQSHCLPRPFASRTVATLEHELNVVHHALLDAVDLDLHLGQFGVGFGRPIAQVNWLCVVCHAVASC